jgi:hypothetical protein
MRAEFLHAYACGKSLPPSPLSEFNLTASTFSSTKMNIAIRCCHLYTSPDGHIV